ncbi:MAG TPA: flagellar hook-basal body protein [Oscillospiraceae bacterium]|nr:flagellar hook-basal body protein [Oscillospiraceae bacterium]
MGAIYSAATGLKGQQTRLDTIAANIANADTAGYKAKRVDFRDALYAAMDAPVGNALEANLLAGSGALVNAASTDFSDGAFSETGGELDFALSGSGFFAVEDAGGETLYTRSGSFAVSSGAYGDYLVTAGGRYVLDRAGNRIALPADRTGLGVTPDGVLRTREGEVAALGIADFPNPDGLLAAGDTCYRASETSGAAVPAGADTTVTQGSLEASNVDMAQELTLLIRSQRAYSLVSRALQTADDMEGLANNIR